ncbi:ABC transporter [Paenibacillus sp. yr247]|nr:ABC transporter [Paenibacillus sp. yr247]
MTLQFKKGLKIKSAFLNNNHHSTTLKIYAACLVIADSFIRELPQGYDTVLSEQLRLSGGQVQRLAISRMLLKEAPCLLLDEPTAGLDMENKELVKKSLEQWGTDRTTILVTHQWDMVRSEDCILMLQAGKMAAYGNHNTLMTDNIMYADMMMADGEVHDIESNAGNQEGIAG